MQESNKQECVKFIDLLHKSLSKYGYQVLLVGEDILCKTPRIKNTTDLNNNTNNIADTSNNKLCPVNTSGIINTQNHTCTCYNCEVSPSDCPLKSDSSLNENKPSSGDQNNNSNSNTSTVSRKPLRSLFRIRPSDNYNSIFLHAITLRGEESDLKMSFEYNNNQISKVIEVINFLA